MNYGHCRGDRDQDHPQEKEMEKGKMVVQGGLINSCEKKRRERQRRKGKIFHLNAEFQRIAKRNKKASLCVQCKETEETIEWKRLETSSRKSEIPKEHFMQRWA